MNVQEACNILGVKPGCSDSDFNAAFREKSKTLHPDKTGGDETKYKKVTEAYNFLKKNGTVEKEPYQVFSDNMYEEVISDFMSGFSSFGFKQQQKQKTIKYFDLEISFEEHILGCEKEYSYQRNYKCSDCNGFSVHGPKCSTCNGLGFLHMRASQQGNVFIRMQCAACSGSGHDQKERKDCDTCKNKGFQTQESKVSMKIMPEQFETRIPGMGDFDVRICEYGDLFFKISIKKSDVFAKNGKNVITTLNLSLLDALKGCVKKVPTVKGEKDLKIKPGIKNKDIISIAGYGVAPKGCQEIIVLVDYPENTENLIKALEENVIQIGE